MGLVVIRTFLDITEALVAPGALRAAEFQAELFDTGYGTVDWVAINAIGGFRLAVPEEEAAEAAAWLQELTDKGVPVSVQTGAEGYVRTTVGLALSLATTLPEGGWLAARRRWMSLAELWGMLIAVVFVILALVLAGWVYGLATYGNAPERLPNPLSEFLAPHPEPS